MTASSAPFRRSELILVVAGIAAMLFLRAWLQRYLLQIGFEPTLAKHSSFLIALPTFILITSPVLYRQRTLLTEILRWQPNTLTMLWRGLVIGALCRIIWWALITLRGSLGLAESTGLYPELLWRFACPPAGILLLSLGTMAVVTPLFEEIAHRGLIQTYFERQGAARAVLISAVIFTVFHTPIVSPVVFTMGIVLAIQFYQTGSLWMSIATHAAYNALAILDWDCVRLQWDPDPETLPTVGTSILCSAVTIAAVAAIVWLIRSKRMRR